ncbi:MAG TPA: glutamine-hydrolyzing carbamoyl-phosphate synthase small subunit [Nitrospirota bacterium]|nr:glutamine-hydrolyzing carbamoyl-phosphate synthase small subunit [Nitrospirota bacterium]
MKRAILALADGMVFEGHSFGAEGETSGEVVFNTSMTGYQEILTDPSYKGQIVTMTYTQIGNYGVNAEDVESGRPYVEGFIVKEYIDFPSNWRAKKSLHQYLNENGIVGIQGIDTRALTRHLRDYGAQSGVISTLDLNPESLVTKAEVLPKMSGLDLVKDVTCKTPYGWDEGDWNLGKGYAQMPAARYKVVAYDYGIKRNILRLLASAGCDVTVVPATMPAEEVLSMNPDGVFLSNGPGDPEPVTYAIENIKKLLGKKPIFGICLGQQLLGLALGGRTYKLKFGHHGGNQPIMDLTTRKVEIAAENHGFAVDMETVKEKVVMTHMNLNDNTCEGMQHKTLPAFSVQYHPEASPGPHDSRYLFQRFVEMMQKHKTTRLDKVGKKSPSQEVKYQRSVS